MKRFLICLFCFFVVVGCDQKEESISATSYLDGIHYTIATPFKEEIAHYVVDPYANFSKARVQNELMVLSSKYFKTTNSLYQAGQYLNLEELKQLLDQKHLNQTAEITINQHQLKPFYIASIEEQNYLGTDGSLKGISIGLVLNPYQAYKNKSGTILYEKIDRNTLYQHAEKMSNQLLEYLHNKKELNDKRILIALYVIDDTAGNGSYQKVGITTSNSIRLEDNTIASYDLESSTINKKDGNNYNAFQALKRDIKNTFQDLYITGNARYMNQSLLDVTISILGNSFSQDQLLYLNQIVQQKIPHLFASNVKVYIKEGNQVVSIYTKESNSLQGDYVILKG